MDPGFRGEVVDFYHRYRRGYPEPVIDALVDAFALAGDDVVVDLGCGTGQLALPVARRVRAVVGVDPEPDMLSRARRAAGERGVANASWVLGGDTDVPALGALLGSRTVGAVTIGQALHWMDHERLFRALPAVLRPGGGVAVVTNGIPVWLQDSDWSRALRGFLERWHGRPTTLTCGSADADQRRYRDTLTGAGFEVREARIEYADELDLEQLIGSVYSAVPVDRLPPPDRRPGFAEQLREALHPHVRYVEQVPVRLLFGRLG